MKTTLEGLKKGMSLAIPRERDYQRMLQEIQSKDILEESWTEVGKALREAMKQTRSNRNSLPSSR